MRILESTASRFSTIQLFLGFTIMLFLVGGGTFALVHYFNDLYAPLPLTFSTTGPLGAAFLVGVAGFIFFFLCAREQKQLQNLGACLVLIALFELAGSGFIFVKAYLSPLRSHRTEEVGKIIELVQEANKDPSTTHRGNFVLVNMVLRLRVLIIQYKATTSMTEINSDEAKTLLRPEACGYLTAYSKFGTLKRVTYLFAISGGNHITIGFEPKDCTGSNVTGAAAPVTAQPAVSAVTPPPYGRELPKEIPLTLHEVAVRQIPPQVAPKNSDDGADRLEKSLSEFQTSMNLFTSMVDRLHDKAILHAIPPFPVTP